MERVLSEAKFEEKKCTSFFEFFGFERPLPRYLLKKVLHCKGSRIWGNAITEVDQRRTDQDWKEEEGSVPKWPVYGRARPSRRAFVENSPSKARIFVILPVYM